MTKAVYAGTFDPVTYGHLWVIEEASKLFDEVVVAVGTNKTKKPWFSAFQRREMISASKLQPNVEVRGFDRELLVNFARRIGATYIVRGIRNARDFQDEQSLKTVNHMLDQNISTVFLMPPSELAEVSSSGVKSVVGFDDWKKAAKFFVPPHVVKALANRHDEDRYGILK